MFSIPIQPTSIFFGLEEHSKKNTESYANYLCADARIILYFTCTRMRTRIQCSAWIFISNSKSTLNTYPFCFKLFSRRLLARVLFGYQVSVWINNVLTFTNAVYYVDILLTKVASSFSLFMNIFYSALYDRYLRVLSKSPTHLRPAY